MIVKVPDNKFNIFFNSDIKSIKVIEPRTRPLQVFKDMWHPLIDKQIIRRQLREEIKNSNIVDRVVYYVITNDGKEGFIPVPRYCPRAFLNEKNTNPYLHFLYKVDSKGFYYFK
jgi:hypothetical protein